MSRIYTLNDFESRERRDASWANLDETEKGFAKEFQESGAFRASESEHYFFHEENTHGCPHCSWQGRYSILADCAYRSIQVRIFAF